MKSLVVAMVCVLGGCSNFGTADSSTGGTTPDGGALPPLQGVPSASVTLAISQNGLVLTHGATTRVGVSIDRTVVADLTISMENLPAGITASPVQAPNSLRQVEVELNVDDAALQGALTGVRVVARGVQSTVIAGAADLVASVRGRSGEPDTTFGEGGVLQLPLVVNAQISTAIFTAADSKGAIYALSERYLRRFTVDGLVDPSLDVPYSTGADPDYFTDLTIRNDHLYVSRIGSVERLDLAAVTDASFGGTGMVSAPDVATTTSVQVNLGIDDAGNFALVRRNVYGTTYNVSFFRPDGALNTDYGTSGSVSGGPVQRWYLSTTYVGNRLLYLGGDSTHLDSLARLALPSGAPDASFANGAGFLRFSGTTLGGLSADKNGYIEVAGVRSDSTVLVTRLDDNGNIDPAFTAEAPGVAASKVRSLADEVGRFNVVANVASGDTTQCVVLRYAPSGKLDSGFGDGGKTTLPAKGCDVRSVLAQPDGRLLVATDRFVQRLWN